MIRTFLRLVWRYWQLSSAVLAAIVSLSLWLGGLHAASNWILGTVSVLLVIPLLVSMWDDLRTGKYGIDILAATAVITSVLLHQYWAAIVIALMLTGGAALEEYAERRAHSELDALLKQAPTTAHILRGRKEVDVAVSVIQPADKILIKVGEVVPVDAIILEGAGSFDEASLTGESLPVEKTVGDQLLSGSINLDGVIMARALHTAADSQYQQIITLVRNAAGQPAPFVRLADRYSIPFTLAAYAIAGTAWFVSGQAIRFLEVIVVATPCPLLLAAPIAFISGMSRASKYGIIVKNGSALEKLAETQTLAFDKTGTLTKGNIALAGVTAFKPFTEAQVLATAASLEQGSAHVLAAAIIEAARAKGVKYTRAKHVSELIGHGLRAQLHGKEVLIGQLGLLSDHGVTFPKNFSAKAASGTTSYVSIGGELAGYIRFSDEIRPEAKQTLQQLKQLGISQFLMITGDSQVVAKAVAKQLNIDNVQAEALPADKLYAIEAINDRPVTFVGDGVNDAPVLTTADVGIALGARGSTAASESADIVILHDDLSHVALALSIAKRTFAIAKQSILVGIGLSFVLMVIFATGHFPPLLGAILQEVVDVVVIFNALRAHLSPKAGS
jgi:heavy metal translocating P-type ATPase